jgi:hypothetical protein
MTSKEFKQKYGFSKSIKRAMDNNDVDYRSPNALVEYRKIRNKRKKAVRELQNKIHQTKKNYRLTNSKKNKSKTAPKKETVK